MPRASPTSLRGQVRTAFQTGGETAALTRGEELGVKPGRLRRWIRKFSGERPSQRRTVDGYVPPTGAPDPLRPLRGNEVYLFKDPAIVAYLIKEGPYQSEVKFPNGNVRTVSNGWFTKIKPEKPLRKRYVPGVGQVRTKPRKRSKPNVV